MFRYKDDVLSLNYFVDATDTDRSASYRDLHFEIDSEGPLRIQLYDKRDVSIFPLWTFHLYVATFPQHRHMEYISLRWYDIPEFVAPINISLIEDAANKEATETIVPFGKVEVITSKMLRLPPGLGWHLFNICVAVTTDMFHLP